MPYVAYEEQRATEETVLLPLSVKEARMLAIMLDKMTELDSLTDEVVLQAMGSVLTRVRRITPAKKGKK